MSRKEPPAAASHGNRRLGSNSRLQWATHHPLTGPPLLVASDRFSDGSELVLCTSGIVRIHICNRRQQFSLSSPQPVTRAARSTFINATEPQGAAQRWSRVLS